MEDEGDRGVCLRADLHLTSGEKEIEKTLRLESWKTRSASSKEEEPFLGVEGKGCVPSGEKKESRT
jgi:hypothetical protein